MALDAWLPVGFRLPDGANVRSVLFAGTDWEVIKTLGGGRALVVDDALAHRWLDAGLIDDGAFDAFCFGERRLQSISCGASQAICPVYEGNRPVSKPEALSFAMALNATRIIDSESALQDALYVEKITRLLPTYSISSRTADEVVLGYWLTGGASIPATSIRRLQQALGWMGAGHLSDVVQTAGFDVAEVVPSGHESVESNTPRIVHADVINTEAKLAQGINKVFELAGRPELTAFFNEHVVDVMLHRDRYKALGIEFPSAVILHGPPGCGKTFAVERLVEFLGWPSFQIDASSVGSPYIHETSKKVAQIFEKAIEEAPSVVVIDEMEAFLADREMGAGASHHRVEEVAEFLRRIPEAVKRQVLIVAMTNRIEMIDPAILRRGRFDHVIKVDFASEIEVRALLDKLLSALPREPDVNAEPLAHELAGRPLSDVTFVVREAARLAARYGKSSLDQGCLMAALKASPARASESLETGRRIGFI
ncbi:ATPase family associated with various cellular activities (AAA) [Burkholderia sp. CF099]|nr:ATPase family associated with various cellular activities (AAA) [Burkholderia sp. CF099]